MVYRKTPIRFLQKWLLLFLGFQLTGCQATKELAEEFVDQAKMVHYRVENREELVDFYLSKGMLDKACSAAEKLYNPFQKAENFLKIARIEIELKGSHQEKTLESIFLALNEVPPSINKVEIQKDILDCLFTADPELVRPDVKAKADQAFSSFDKTVQHFSKTGQVLHKVRFARFKYPVYPQKTLEEIAQLDSEIREILSAIDRVPVLIARAEFELKATQNSQLARNFIDKAKKNIAVISNEQQRKKMETLLLSSIETHSGLLCD